MAEWAWFRLVMRATLDIWSLCCDWSCN